MVQGVQQSLPLAVVRGKAVSELPIDLFIPPEALEVFLEAFEGPLDLLLYLIRKQKLDVVELPLHLIASQYLEYIRLLSDSQIELAADYLVMAATLAEIKSRLLLPKMVVDDVEEEDPRQRLVRQLKAYETVRDAANKLDSLPRLERDLYQARVQAAPGLKVQVIAPDVSLKELSLAFATVLKRASASEHHHVQKDSLSTRERMGDILTQLSQDQFTPFVTLFAPEEGRTGVVVSFLALMELLKESLVELYQAEPLSVIYVKAA